MTASGEWRRPPTEQSKGLCRQHFLTLPNGSSGDSMTAARSPRNLKFWLRALRQTDAIALSVFSGLPIIRHSCCQLSPQWSLKAASGQHMETPSIAQMPRKSTNLGISHAVGDRCREEHADQLNTADHRGTERHRLTGGRAPTE